MKSLKTKYSLKEDAEEMELSFWQSHDETTAVLKFALEVAKPRAESSKLECLCGGLFEESHVWRESYRNQLVSYFYQQRSDDGYLPAP